MPRFLASALALVALALGLSALPAAADVPTQFVETFSFEDVDPCTGLVHTVTVTDAISVHEHGDRLLANGERTITTSPTGYVGHGSEQFVFNVPVFANRFADVLANDAGDRILVRGVLVVDLSTDTVRVDQGKLTCLSG